MNDRRNALKDYNEEKNETRYRLVHPIEAQPEKGLISLESPIGKALRGKRGGERVGLNDM